MRSRASRRDRIERESQARRARARAHLERVRSGHGGTSRRAATGAPWRMPALPRPALLAAALFAGSALGGLWLGDDALAAAGAGPWRLREVAVRGAERLAPREVARAATLPADTRWSAVDPAAIARALESHDWIARARVARVPGGALVLDVTERRAAAATRVGGSLFAVDAEGRPFAPLGEEEAAELPHLRTATEPALREPHPRIARAVAIARALPERGLALPREVGVSAEGDPRGFALRLPGLAAEFVLGAEAPEERLDALAELLARRPAEVAAAARVDLRFEDQAVLDGEADPGGKAQEAAWRGGDTTSEREPRG